MRNSCSNSYPPIAGPNTFMSASRIAELTHFNASSASDNWTCTEFIGSQGVFRRTLLSCPKACAILSKLTESAQCGQLRVELIGRYLPTLAVGIVKPFCLLMQDEILGRSRRDAVRLVPASGIEQRSEMCFQIAPGKVMFNCLQLDFAGALKTHQCVLTRYEIHRFSLCLGFVVQS